MELLLIQRRMLRLSMGQPQLMLMTSTCKLQTITAWHYQIMAMIMKVMKIMMMKSMTKKMLMKL